MTQSLYLKLIIALIISTTTAHRILLAESQQSDQLTNFVRRPGIQAIQLKDYIDKFQKLYAEQKSEDGLKQIPEALMFAEYRYGKASQQYAKILSWGCSFAKDTSKYQQAIDFGKESLSILKNVLGEDHPDVAEILNKLGLVYHVSENRSPAEDLYLRAVTINSNFYGKHNFRVATNLRNLGLLLSGLGDPKRASSYLLQVLKINQSNHGETHEIVERSHTELALEYKKIPNFKQAETHFQLALEINEQLLGSEHQGIGKNLGRLGVLYCDFNKYDKALPLFKRRLEIDKKMLGANHPQVASDWGSLGYIQRCKKQYSLAELSYSIALQIDEKNLGPLHEDIAHRLTSLGLVHRDMSNFDQAESFLERAATIYSTKKGNDHFLTKYWLGELSDLKRKHVLRTWKDSSGDFSRHARWVKLNDDIVILQLEDNETIEIPYERLSKEDQRFIKNNLQNS